MFLRNLWWKKVNRQIYKHCDRKGKKYTPIYFVCLGYKVAAVAVDNNTVVAVIDVVEVVNVAAVAVVNVAETALIFDAVVADVNVAAVAVFNFAAVAVIKVAELTDYLP